MAYMYIKDITNVNRDIRNYRNIKYIVIHYTGNPTDTAKANGNYFRNVNRGASAHYFVDNNFIVQCVEDKDAAWAVGRNYGSNNLYGIVTNENSISIEMCSVNGSIAPATFNNTVTLTKELMARYGIPASNVYRHFDVCSKQCPGWAGWGTKAGDNGSEWNRFKAALVYVPPVKPAENPANKKSYKVAGKSKNMYGFKTIKSVQVRVAPNSDADVVAIITSGSSQGINMITKDGWGHLANNAGWIPLKYTTPINAVGYELKASKAYVREIGSGVNSGRVATLKKGSRQSICFIANNNFGLISNFAGWVDMKHWKKI